MLSGLRLAGACRLLAVGCRLPTIRMRRALILSLLVTATFASEARAQSQAVIGLGLAITSYDPTGNLGLSYTSIGPLFRFNLGPGFGPSLGFDWYEAGALAMAGTTPVYVGRLRVRPVMAGVTYNWKRDKYWLTMSVVGGYAFTALLGVNNQARPLLRSSLGTSEISFDSTNSFVWRPQLGFWYDAAPRVGITASIAYIGLHPKLRIGNAAAVREMPLDAACSVLTFGLVYGVF